jgi:hypothetical protein
MACFKISRRSPGRIESNNHKNGVKLAGSVPAFHPGQMSHVLLPRSVLAHWYLACIQETSCSNPYRYALIIRFRLSAGKCRDGTVKEGSRTLSTPLFFPVVAC